MSVVRKWLVDMNKDFLGTLHKLDLIKSPSRGRQQDKLVPLTKRESHVLQADIGSRTQGFQ